jgi:DNA-binding transcriptional ArsR family regulator
VANAVTLEIDKMRGAAEEATSLLRALANSDRLLLLCHLSQGECCVGDLEEELQIQQPTLSQQLTVLRTRELVSTRRDGKRIYYSVSDPKALAVLETLYRLFCAGRKAPCKLTGRSSRPGLRSRAAF